MYCHLGMFSQERCYHCLRFLVVILLPTRPDFALQVPGAGCEHARCHHAYVWPAASTRRFHCHEGEAEKASCWGASFASCIPFCYQAWAPSIILSSPVQGTATCSRDSRKQVEKLIHEAYLVIGYGTICMMHMRVASSHLMDVLVHDGSLQQFLHLAEVLVARPF